MSLTAEQRVEAERHLREWMQGRRDAHSVAGKTPALLAEVDRLQATVTRRGELLRAATKLVQEMAEELKVFCEAPIHLEQAREFKDIVRAELAEGEDDHG